MLLVNIFVLPSYPFIKIQRKAPSLVKVQWNMLLLTYKRQLVMQDDSRGTAGNVGVPVIMYVPAVAHAALGRLL